MPVRGRVEWSSDGTHKLCRGCGRFRLPAAFGRKCTASDGLQTYCRPCQNARTVANQRVYEQENQALREADDPRAELPKYCRACRRMLTRGDFYVKTRAKDGLQTYCIACLSARNAINAFNLRARRLGCVGSLTRAEHARMAELQEGRCARCSKSLADDCCIDHIKPAGPGVSNRPDNLQLLCRRCNARKKGRDSDYRRPEWLAVWPK